MDRQLWYVSLYPGLADTASHRLNLVRLNVERPSLVRLNFERPNLGYCVYSCSPVSCCWKICSEGMVNIFLIEREL
jgi:hypothetical protein